MKRIYRFITICALLAAVAVTLGGVPRYAAQAQTPITKLYFPLMFKSEPVRLDTFDTHDPSWTIMNLKAGFDNNTKTFFDWRNSLLYCGVKDNSDRWVIHPNWRPLGDFQLEVDGRFLWKHDQQPPAPQTWTAFGLAFGGSNDWLQGYNFSLAFGLSQPFWVVSRFDGLNTTTKRFIVHDLTVWGGAPDFVRNWDGWNHLTIVRIQDRIYPYVNGILMPLPDPYEYVRDGTYGTNRLVGLLVTSYEWSGDEIEFDNFKLTPLSMPY